MKKQLLIRGLSGFPIGVTIGFAISIVISVCIGDGTFYPVTPSLLETAGNELNAVILQTFLCGLMGSAFAMASIIWEIDSWSLAKQSGSYFAIACLVMLPVAYITNWMAHSIQGFISYTAIFAIVFMVIWLTRYGIWKIKIKQMNTSIKKQKNQHLNE